MAARKAFGFRFGRDGLADIGRLIGIGPRRQGGSNLPPCLEAAIDQAARIQMVEGAGIFIEMLRLPAHGARPVEAEPFEV